MRALPPSTALRAGTQRAAYVSVLLFLANMFNYADRSLLGIVVEPIRHELRLSDTQIGLLSGAAFSLFFLLAGIAIARWVDRGNRAFILALGVALWSGATAGTGLAQGFASMALCRMLIGVGESTVFNFALSMLPEFYPGPQLSRSVSVFQSSAGVGLMVGAVLAGILAAAHGWRAMFLMFGAAGGLLVLLLAFTLKASVRRAVPGEGSGRNGGLLPAIAAILSVPGLRWLVLGYAVSNMVLASLPTWAPAFLLRSHGVALAGVGALVGPPAVIGGLTGTILSGVLASRLIERGGNRWAGMMVPIIALPLAVPAFALFLFAPSIKLVVLGVAVMNFLLSSSLGPCVALAVSLVPAPLRGLTSTLLLIVHTLIAFAFGPLLVGMASDALTPIYGEDALRHALALLLVAPLVASFMIWLAQRRRSGQV